jgi:hypothetical protein
VALEELDRALVALGRRPCGERAKVAALTSPRILLPGEEPVLPRGQLADHPYAAFRVAAAFRAAARNAAVPFVATALRAAAFRAAAPRRRAV